MDNGSLSRRTLIAAAASVPLARLATAGETLTESTEQTTPPSGPFVLPPLPYSSAALEKAIDRQTMRIHHDKHHAAYVNGLNDAIRKASAELQSMPVASLLWHIDRVPEEIRQAVINHGGGHDNHSLFWTSMSPRGGGKPTGLIADLIERRFGGFDAFKQTFNDAGTKRFGSGWAWLVMTKERSFEVLSRPNQDSPRMEKMTPILGNDVWEHAYYLRYQNRRADYLKAWWNVVNWDEINLRLQMATAEG